MILIDTTVWVDYFRNVSTPQTDWLDAEVSRQRLGLTDLILCEVLQGISAARQFEATQQALEQFEIFTTGGILVAVSAAIHYRQLRARSITVRRTIDCLIASFCLLHGHHLLHNDRDYDPFETFLGLHVIHP